MTTKILHWAFAPSISVILTCRLTLSAEVVFSRKKCRLAPGIGSPLRYQNISETLSGLTSVLAINTIGCPRHTVVRPPVIIIWQEATVADTAWEATIRKKQNVKKNNSFFKANLFLIYTTFADFCYMNQANFKFTLQRSRKTQVK